LPALTKNELKQTKIDINTFNYKLPEGRIAKYPMHKRSDSKLLIYYPNSSLRHTKFSNISNEIETGSLVIYNNTRVIHARLLFQKPTGANIEIFLLSPDHPSDYQQIFNETSSCTWSCMVGNLKKWREGPLNLKINVGVCHFILKAEKSGIDINYNQLINFSWESGLSFAEILNHAGKIPIPPYLNRDTEKIDQMRYQTVYSKLDGSVAAPTAGLHFTSQVFDDFKNKKIETAEVTLHVGAGTFQPVKSENAMQHKMHGEQITIDKHFLEKLANSKGKIIATGTTTLRTLESIYWLGVKAINGERPEHLLQWEWQILPHSNSLQESIDGLLKYLESNNLCELKAKTEIMIIPGYRFKVVDALITNFHQPESTLLLLISAFVGEQWKNIYDYALANDFRFLSYGDSSLLFRD
jgi:S-adenosylmethionine:tRNA ribosyltransferase-isomerase